MQRLLAKHGVTPIEAEGQKFDPHKHQAMFEVPDPTRPEGTVVQVVQAGFAIGDRVLRPAMVGVAKGGPKAGQAEHTARRRHRQERVGVSTPHPKKRPIYRPGGMVKVAVLLSATLCPTESSMARSRHCQHRVTRHLRPSAGVLGAMRTTIRRQQQQKCGHQQSAQHWRSPVSLRVTKCIIWHMATGSQSSRMAQPGGCAHASWLPSQVAS